VLALPTDTKNFIGVIGSFLAHRERLGILSEWAPDSPIASALEALGRATWADVQLLEDLRPLGYEHTVRRQLHKHTASHYLVAMTAARRANSINRQHEPFVERLRLLLLIRAVEADEQGVIREANLADACLTIRQVADETEHPKWSWVAHIAHRASGFHDFVCETHFQLRKAMRANTTHAPDLHFYKSLTAVLDGDLRALLDSGQLAASGTLTKVEVLASPWPNELTRLTSATSEDEEAIDSDRHLAVDVAESQSFATGRVDTARPPPAQRDQATGIVLQSLEDSQYLRHSWHRLSQVEEGELQNRLLNLMQSDQADVDRLGSALTVVAMLTSTPLSALGYMPIASGLSADWSLTLSEGALRRRPSRFSKGWTASESNASRWVRPLVVEWRIDLSPEVRDALLLSTGDLWNRLSPTEPLHIWFGRRLADTESLERLTSPVVSSVMGQLIFEHAGDHAQARLVSASTRSGLPSPCAYGAYGATELQNTLGRAIPPVFGALVEPNSTSSANATGSELDVDLHRMAEAIGAMISRLDRVPRQPQNWVDHHNQLSALCVIALLASTGARPVNSPFESLDWMDLTRRILYVEDKHSGPTRGSRLCALSDYCHDLLTNHYLPHLKMLARGLSESEPGLTAEIGKILSRDPGCRLPLFFFLRAEPTLDWIEVSESQLTLVCKHPWPLPWNVFRHLHATQLRRWGLNTEIRDALLSHGERGAESHGAHSWRVPRHDLEVARPLVNRLSVELGFRLPSKQPFEPRISAPRGAGLDFSTSTPFGRVARAQRRDATHRAACRTAKFEIEELIGNSPPSSLSEEAWDKIARVMLFRPNGLPHPMASVRYEILEDHLSALWQTEGVQLALPKLRRIPLQEGISTFKEEVIGAEDQLEHFRRRFDALNDLNGVRAPRMPVLAGCLAALELVLQCRVSNFAVLAAVACNGKAIRLVRFDSRYWLEWAYRGEWRDGRPNYRVPITERAAGWVGVAQSSKKQLAAVPKCPDALRVFVGGEAFGPRLRELASLVGQMNNLEMPGAMAAALSGERETAALPHSDWMRTMLLSAPLIGQAVADSEPPADEEEDHFFRNHHRATTAANDTDALSRCKSLFDAILRALSPQAITGVAATPDRRAAEIDRAVQASEFGHGDGPFVLAHYAAHLLKRRKQAGPGGTLKASTALRYWEALKQGFLDFAFDVHLPELKEDELTALYAKIVNAAEPTSADEMPPVSTGHAHRRKLKDDSDSSQRTLDELVDFHEFAHGRYGLEDPDWSEISPGRTVGIGRPGIVLLAEYEAALCAFAPQGQVHLLDDDSLAAAFVLLTCARFGLRGGEAVGLQRRDLVQICGSVVILVRSNHLRPLKNIPSKRQVPLIGTFSELERGLVDETVRRWEHRDGVDRNSPLLPGVSTRGFKLQQRWVSSLLLPLIKSVTTNQASVIHHLRHGFACRLLSLLSGRQLGAAIRHTETETDNARRLMMTSKNLGRQTLWSVARLLGHATPESTWKAYLHVMDAWLPAPPLRRSANNLAVIRSLVNLDAVHSDPTYLSRTFSVPTRQISPETSWVQALRFLRLRALGNSNAEWLSKLDRLQVESLDDALRVTVSRLKIMPENERSVQALLSGVKAKRWNHLTDLAILAPKRDAVRLLTNWTGTIGANRQIVLFEPEHFDWAGQFVKALGMTPDDCRCVYSPRSHPILEGDLARSGLTPYGVLRSEHARTFQIDLAVEGPREKESPHRAALVPNGVRLVRDSIELVVLWVTWLWSSATAVDV